MKEFRVTKYNPANRNELGNYLDNEEWTEFSDVGTNVSLDEYERVESAYIESAMDFLESAGIAKLNIKTLENYNQKCRYKENDAVAIDVFENELRSVLRGEYWCRFESEAGFLHIGYDYYMYVGVISVNPATIERTEHRGLFVENFVSPYHPEGSNV